MNNTLANGEVIYNSLSQRLSDTNKKELFYNFAKNELVTIIGFSAFIFLFVLLEAVFRFSTGVRTILFWTTISTLVTTLIFFAVNYFLKRTGVIRPFDPVIYSKKVGNKFTVIKDSLSNSMSLFKNNSASVFSDELILANLEKVNERSGGINFSSFIPFGKLKKLSIILIASFVLYSICFAIFPGTMFGSLNRLVNYQYNFIDGEYGIIFEIEPGSTEVVKGERVDISILVKANKEGLDIRNLKFYTKELKRDGTEILLNEKELETTINGYFLTSIESVNTDLVYYAEYEGIESDKYEIKILDYPIVKSFRVTVHPPELTGMPPRQLKENEGDIFCPEGSRLEFELTSSRELSLAGIELNGNLNAFNITGDKASGSVTVSNSGTYKFVLKDAEGRENRNSKLYNIKVVNDDPPKIVIIEPKESNYTLKGERELIVRARISDDFGFSKLTLHYSKTNGNNSASGNYTIVNIPIKNLTATSLEVPYLWSIAGLGLSSGERVEYYMEVTDNTGKTARSDTRILQYKSLTEIIKESEQMTKELKSDLESVTEDAFDLQKQLMDLKNKSQMNEELGLNEQQKKELQQQVENVQKNLDATQNKINQSIDQMKQNNLSDKTLEQYMKMQELFSKINTPELQEMLKKLKEALQKNNKDEMRDAMKNFNFDEEAFKKNLEKIMEMMKKIEALQDFGKLTEKLDELTKDQDKLNEETKQTDGNDKEKLNDLSNKQNEVKDKTDEFKEALKDLIEKMKEMKDDEMSPQDLQKLLDQMNKMNPQDKMQNSKDQLQKGQKQNSEQTQENISKDLNDLNKQMQDALEKQLSMMDMNSKMMDKMEGIKEKLEELSKKQQELRDKTEDLSQSDKQEMKENSKEQQGLQQDLSEQINDLMNLSKSGAPVSPELGKELGNSYNSMDKAGENLDKGNKNDASNNQGKAKESLDNAAKMLGDMMGQMKQQGKDGQSGEGKMGQLMKQLADIIGQQQGLNGKMGQFGENGTGKEGKNGKEGKDGLTPQQKEQLQKLQLEQEQLSKSLEDLNKELEEEKQRSGEKVLGNLEEIKKQMQDVIKDMQDQNITKETLEKQNRILSRLLDAQLSQREKDFEQKRESRPGTNYTRTSPPEVVLSGPKSFNALKEEFLKLQKEGYTEDYEELITKYLLELRKNGYVTEE